MSLDMSHLTCISFCCGLYFNIQVASRGNGGRHECEQPGLLIFEMTLPRALSENICRFLKNVNKSFAIVLGFLPFLFSFASSQETVYILSLNISPLSLIFHN